MDYFHATIDEMIMPALPLRGLAVFPHMVLHFDVAREKSIAALESAMLGDQRIFLVSQREVSKDQPDVEDIYEVGTIARIKQLLKLPGDNIRVLVEGVERAALVEFYNDRPGYVARVARCGETAPAPGDLEVQALMRGLLDVFEQLGKLSNKVSPETYLSVSAVSDPSQLADIIAANVLTKLEDKQTILQCMDVKQRLEKMLEILVAEVEILDIERKIQQRVRAQIDKSQREYYLREQIKAIQTELGEKEGLVAETEELSAKVKELPLSQEAKEKAEKEIERMRKMNAGTPELGVIRSYVDWILMLPWGKFTEDNTDLSAAQKVLDDDHYGLAKVKERIVESIAVRMLTKENKSPILCFVGPPGVGKTSIAASIAKALGRKFVRMSLGGVRDEAEIRGHRRTYIGAIPGRIVSMLKEAGSMNPLFLLDEVDKLSSDFRGDPASALLEVLDPEQNNTFRDHYLDIDIDLSQVLFVTTANTMDTIPRPLLDRMEVIEVTSYTLEEKQCIATRHLLPKQLKEHGLKDKQLTLDTVALKLLISNYTRESGVRNLEREIANICRKVACEVVNNPERRVRVTARNLHKYLGIPRYTADEISHKDEVGIATGLAWTSVGGQTLSVEVTPMVGSGKFELTGQLGDVMKESAYAGLSYARSRAEALGIDPEFYNKQDIHVHVPAGAIPKDGPSAGITMATALISALSGRPVRGDLAMTGEITLRGRVLPIGGLKEKALAAHRMGLKTVLIPEQNKKDLEDIPANVRRDLDIQLVGNMEQVLQTALV